MKKYISQLYYGFQEGLSISSAFELEKKEFLNKNFLVTCLDSTKNYIELPKWMTYLQDNGFEYRTIGKAVLIIGDYEARLFSVGKTFYHFDEVYLFEKNIIPNVNPSRTYTSDGYDFNNKLPNDLVSYFKKIKAMTYLSDGCGLNFITMSEGLAEKLSANVRITNITKRTKKSNIRRPT